MRIILSYNSRDLALAEAFRATLFVHAPDLKVYFSPAVLETHRSLPVDKADAILLFVGPRGCDESQRREFRLAENRQQRSKVFKMIPILAAGGTIPEDLESTLTWIAAPVVTDRNVAHQIIDMLLGEAEPRLIADKKIPLWRRLWGAA